MILLSASLGGSNEGRSVGRPRPKCRSGSGLEEGRSVGPTRVGIGLGRRVGSVGRMLKMLLRTTITPQTTADPDTYTCDADSVGCRERLQPDHAYLSHAN